MTFTKYNPQTGRETLHRMPDRAVLMTNNMKQIVPCCNCYRDMVYGDSYTSRLILNQIGLGAPVCEECYKKECLELKE